MVPEDYNAANEKNALAMAIKWTLIMLCIYGLLAVIF
jgi:hypothetical protein